MFRKLLKYDMRPMLRLWLILTGVALTLSVFGGLCWRGLMVSSADPMKIALLPFSAFGLMMAFYGLVAYLAAISIIIIVRFYRNFFTDEGYLTFTLPVKRSTLFNSKLVTALVFNTATFVVFILSIVIILAIAPANIDGTGSMLTLFIDTIRIGLISLGAVMTKALAAWITVFILLFVLLMLVSYVFTTLLMFCCVIFGSIIVKKLKFLMAVGLYYAVMLGIEVLGYIFTIIASFTIQAISADPTLITGAETPWFFALILLGVTAGIGIVCCFLYKFAVNRLRGNLNLA